MGKLFDLDSPLMRVLSKMADLMILNLLMIVLCLPIITAGAAFTAMHYVLLKMVRDEDSYLLKSFFKSFKLNFRQATIIWAIMLGIAVIFIGDFIIMKGNQTTFPGAFVALLLAITVLVFCVCMYVFPVLAKFDNTIWNTIKNSFFMMSLNLPKTILMVLVYAVPVVIILISPIAFPLIILFGISLPGYIAAMLYNKVFKRFEPVQEEITSDEDFIVLMDDETEVTAETMNETKSAETVNEAESAETVNEAEHSEQP